MYCFVLEIGGRVVLEMGGRAEIGGSVVLVMGGSAILETFEDFG